MPFKSDSQRKLCYLLKGKGQAGSWDCDEWSTATGKKKLPEHVEDQTEKKASGLNDVKALCALWAAPSPIKEAAAKSLLSKLSSVITSPGRGSGDIEESAVDPDPSEGMQKAKPMPARMGHRGVNKFVSPKGAARTALMQATKRVFGEDINNRGIKTAGRFGVFPNIGKLRKEASQGAPAATPKLDSVSSTGPAPVNENPTASASSAPPPPADPIQPAVTPTPKPNTSKPLFPGSPIASGVVNGVNTGVQALFDPKAHENLKQMAGRPDIPKAYKDVGEWWNRNTAGGVDKAIDYGVDAYMGKKPEGLLDGPAHETKSWLLKNQIKGYKNNASTKLNNAVTLANTAIDAVPGARPAVNAVGAGVNDAVQGVQQGAYNGVAKFDAERQTAGYALPAVNWMNANPWAKYLGGAALGGLGLYGLNKLMGGRNKSKGTGSTLDQNFQQGLASQQPRR